MDKIKESFNKHLSELKQFGIDITRNIDINVIANNDGDYMITSTIFCKSNDEIELKDKINSLTKSFSYPSFITFSFPEIISKQAYQTEQLIISTTTLLISTKNLKKHILHNEGNNDNTK